MRTDLEVKATKNRDRSQKGEGRYKLSLLQTLFFLREEEGGMEAEEFTGHRLHQYLEQLAPGLWPIPNAGRHFLRTYLTQAGCPETVINTVMGHWGVGESAWAPDSALDPLRYREELAPHLESALDAIGYRVMDPVVLPGLMANGLENR